MFAERGYHGATLRDITAAGDALLGLATYYFGTKEELFRAVLLRREPALSASISRALDTLLAGSPHPTPRQVIAAFVVPHAELVAADSAWRDYFRVLNQLAGFDNRVVRGAALFDTFHAVFQRFIDTLCRVLPDARPERIRSAMVMVRMLQVTFIAESLAGGAASDVDRLPLDMHRDMIRFCVTGFCAFVEDEEGRGRAAHT